MKHIFNTLLFTILVPATVAGWIPWRLHSNAHATSNVGLVLLSILLIAIGIAIYLHTAFWGFALRGRGTPAPIAPPKRLVVEGLHRYVRNPMYIGVLLIVVGQVIPTDGGTMLAGGWFRTARAGRWTNRPRDP